MRRRTPACRRAWAYTRPGLARSGKWVRKVTHRDATPRGVTVGDVLYLHESITRFSRKDCLRWCVVTAVFGRNVRVAGRSTTRTDGVSVPSAVMPEFTVDGWIPRPPVRISLADAAAARNVGRLPEPYLTQVMFHMNEDMP